MKRWVQYNLPVFVLVEYEDSTRTGHVHTVVAATEPHDLYPAQATSGGFRVYDENLLHLDEHPSTQARALAVAEQRDKWPACWVLPVFDEPGWHRPDQGDPGNGTSSAPTGP